MGHYKKQRNTTRSSNTSTQSSTTSTSTNTITTPSENDDFSVSIKIKNSSRNSTPKHNHKKEIHKQVLQESTVQEQEPEPEKPRLPEWEEMGITEEEYWSLRKKTAEQMKAYQLDNLRRSMLRDYDSTSYWKERREQYERFRERYNKARGWSATTLSAVEHIDANIEECRQRIQYLEENYVEDDYYEDEV